MENIFNKQVLLYYAKQGYNTGKKTMILLLLLFLVHRAGAQAEFKSDQEIIISQCLSFQPLQDTIPSAIKDKIDRYQILDHGVVFYFSSTMKVKGKRVDLISKSAAEKSLPYFLFHTLNIEKEQALVRYYFVYTEDGIESTIPVVIEFIKKDSRWQISTYSI